jgi:hypothetical protein
MDELALHTIFTDADIRDTRPAVKIGLLATVSPQGLPHVTLISSLMACSPTRLSFGQFVEGRSKQHLRERPQAGFLIMSPARNVWRGTALFRETAKAGPEFDHYNDVPMFRYNAYLGIHTVYYLDLVAHSGPRPLPTGRVVFAALQSMLARTVGDLPDRPPALNPWTRALLDKLDNLKFLAYVRADGHPVLIPALQAQSLDAAHVVFSLSVYRDELEAIPVGTCLAVFGMTLAMEDVLVRGVYRGVRRVGGVRVGVLEVDWVYNSMPPVPGQVYPPTELAAVTDFEPPGD